MMNFNRKLMVLTVLPMIIAMCTIGYWVTHQTHDFSTSQAREFKHALIAHRKQQLHDYVSIVQSAVGHLKQDIGPLATITEENAKIAELTRILNVIEFSEDGYFYVYDEHGNNIIHPRQPFRVGKNWIDLKDSQGKAVISNLVSQAKAGGGYTEYLWEKPSSGVIASKIGYSEMLGNRNWMIGTGAYIDDIDQQVSDVQYAMAPHINSTVVTGAWIAGSAVLFVFVGGLLFQLNEKKLADDKLRALTRRIVQTQDEERRRVSRELHDSISQSLVGLKYVLENIQSDYALMPTAVERLKSGVSHLDQTLSEVTRISRNLHPSILDDIGLMAAAEALLDSFRQRTSIDIHFNNVKVRHLLPEEARTALYRVVQEALTNIERHSRASEASITFGIRGTWFGVTISDNGVGFNVDDQGRESQSVQRGIGLRNISERLDYLHGICEIKSSPSGTQIFAGVPKSMLRRPIATWE